MMKASLKPYTIKSR